MKNILSTASEYVVVLHKLHISVLNDIFVRYVEIFDRRMQKECGTEAGVCHIFATHVNTLTTAFLENTLYTKDIELEIQ